MRAIERVTSVCLNLWSAVGVLAHVRRLSVNPRVISWISLCRFLSLSLSVSSLSFFLTLDEGGLRTTS